MRIFLPIIRFCVFGALALMILMIGVAAAELSSEDFLSRFAAAIQLGDFQAAESFVKKYPKAAAEVRFMHIPDGDVVRHLSDMLTRYLESRPQLDPGLIAVREMNRLYREGQQAMMDANYPLAVRRWKKGLSFAETGGGRRAEAAFYSNLGVAYDHLGFYGSAIDAYSRALAIDREMSDIYGLANDLSNVGVIQMNMGQYMEALKNLREALALHRNLGRLEGESANLSNIGLIFQNQGQYEKALQYYKEALALKRKINDRRGEGLVLSNIGIVNHNLGQYEQAVKQYQEALKIHRELNDLKGVAKDLSNMGLIHNNMGEYEKALESYQESLAIAQKINDRRGEGANIANIGLAHHNLGNHDKALAHYQEALAIHQEIGDRRGEGRDLANIGMLYDQIGEDKKALEAMRRSLETAEEIGAPEALWRAQRRLGQVEASQGLFNNAIGHYEAALETIEILRERLSARASRSSFMRGKIYIYDELIEMLQTRCEENPDEPYFKRKALEIFERKQGRLFLEEIGKSGARNFAGVPEEVLEEERQIAIEVANLRDALAQERSRPKDSISPEMIRKIEDELSAAYSKQRQFQQRLETEHPDYHELKYPRPANVKTIQNQVLARNEVILAYDIRTNGASAWVIGQKHFSMHRLPTRTHRLEDAIKLFRDYGIQLKSRSLRGIKHKDSRNKKPEIKIEPQEAPALYPILFPPAVRQAVSIAFGGSDDGVAIGASGCAHGSGGGGGGATGGILYIVPTGPLYELPFECLNVRDLGKEESKPEEDEDDEGPRYLIENHAVSYLSSASLLKILRDSQARRRNLPEYPLLAFANPIYDETVDFEPLPETEDEVRAIGQLLRAPAESSPLHVGKAAARSNVIKLNKNKLLADYRYLVFATHGVLPGEIDQATQPALILSSPDPETGKAGFLTMADVFDLSLGADLVSLSACNTGRGVNVRGEGVQGLTRAFMFAGAPAIAVTLWAVESESIKDLNVGMYKNMAADMGRAQALRAVKLRMIQGNEAEAWQHPFYWAPMVLFGDGR